MKTYIITFGDGTKYTVEADSSGAARAKAQDRKFPNGIPFSVFGNSPKWLPLAIVDVKEVKRAVA